MSELIITNGDSTVDLLDAAGFDADLLPWRDVLHEGPVPETPNGAERDLERLSTIRAAFLADAFAVPPATVQADFEKRDRTIIRHDDYDEVTLWFEHDLYDQLQLLQILAFFHGEERLEGLHIVQADDYLGRQTPESMSRFAALKAPVSSEQARLADSLFRAFRRPSPTDLRNLLDQDLQPLPYIKSALYRLFQELPSTSNGLSRTQQQALAVIEQKNLRPKRLFGAVQRQEEAVFMGDTSFWRCLDEIAFDTAPLIQGLPDRFDKLRTNSDREAYLSSDLTLTDTGHAVLSQKADHAAINKIDRWLGGTHVSNDTLWRWDRKTAQLAAPDATSLT